MGKAIKVKQYRKRARLSQRALAARLGVTGAYLSMIESGARRPSLALAHRFASVSRGAVPVEVWK